MHHVWPTAEAYQAVQEHGAGIPPGGGIRPEYGGYERDPSGALQIRLVDAYGRFSRQDAPLEAAYHGVARLFLGPAQFRLAASDGALSYVRAVVKTVSARYAADSGMCAKVAAAGSKCGNRYGYSNPIWGKYLVSCPQGRLRPPRGGLLGLGLTPVLDGDANGVADACERDLADPCPARGGRGPVGGLTPGERPEVATDEHTRPPTGPRPAKPIPRNSCQFVAVAPPSP